MRRAAGCAVAAVAVVGWAGASVLRSAPTEAQSPVAEIRRVQHAEFTPAMSRRRPVFVLVLGSDARPGEEVDRLHADSIHIVSLNAQRRAGAVVGIPRDSYVSIPGHGQSRINDAMVEGGPELQVRTVEQLTGITLDYYLLTSFPGLVNLVNGVGGITVPVPYPMRDGASGTDFDAGRRHLSGAEALAFSRDRHSGAYGDFNRSFNQGILIHAALKEMRSQVRRDPAKLLKWMAVGMRDIDADIPVGDLFDLAATAVQVRPTQVRNAVVPGSPGFAGAASVVFLDSRANAIFRDLRDDGLLEADVRPRSS
ncbi:MAG: LCP family protein [Actinomycetota bacterium]|nr:LCP family protein [Actinomycetota bacterium]